MAQPIYLDPELQGIERQRQLAQALMQRGMKPVEGQMVSGRYVAPAWTQQLANMFDIYSGRKGMEEAEKKSADYATALRAQTGKDIQQFLQGGQTIVPEGQTLRDDEGGLTYGSQLPKSYMERIGQLAQSRSPQSQALAQSLMSEMLKPQKLAEGESLIRMTPEGKYEAVGTGGEKMTNDFRNYQQAVSQGYQGTFMDYQQSIKKAGAPNIDLSNLMGKNLAGQIGDIAKESRVSAMGAVQTADSANRILNALDTNKLFTGSGANVRLDAARIADTFGLGGKDTGEKIANSRQTLQGLAQLTLQGRKQMRGEGAITESESKLAERAMSGDLSFTAAEIRQLAEAAKRSAKFTYNMHQNIIGTMQKDPTTRELVPFYQVPAEISIFEPRASGATSDVRSRADQIIRGQ